MADRLEKLRVALRELEVELQALGTLDDATREQLAQAAEEIAISLRRGQRLVKASPDNDSLQGKLAEFEAEHPQFAGVVSRLLDGLAQLGI
jgi:hypothetical protein